MWYETFIDNNLIPRPILQLLIRYFLHNKANTLKRQIDSSFNSTISHFIDYYSSGEIANETNSANQQHYEVPTEFFEVILGPRLKYSACVWSCESNKIDVAENKTLAMYCDLSKIKSNQTILDLGCGWGSLGLYIAEKYPSNNVICLSNSKTQKSFIDKKIEEKQLRNIKVITEDIKSYSPNTKFDRILSIEMFEHLKNVQAMFSRINDWLNPEGLLLLQTFSHKQIPHTFHDRNHSWMAKHFFTSGSMPSHTIFKRILPVKSLVFIDSWSYKGTHYKKTLNEWLINLESNKKKCIDILASHPYPISPEIQYNRWKLFLLICIELFGFNEGNEWLISNHLIKKVDR